MSIDAEKAVVGAVIKSAAVFESVNVKINVEDFIHQPSKLVYQQVCEYRTKGQHVDAVTLAAKLNGSDAWELTGFGDASGYFTGLPRKSAGNSFIDSYIGVIKSASMTRALLEACEQISNIAYNSDISLDEKLSQARSTIPDIDTVSTGGFIHYGDAATQAAKQIRMKVNGESIGLTSGFDNLDELIGGFEPGTLVIVAGRPSHGKSIYAMDFAHHAAKAGQVLVFSFEMTAANLAQRGMASLGSVDFGPMRAGKLDEHMLGKMNYAKSSMKKMNLWIDDRAGVSVDQACTRARVMARKEQPVLIVADYLTLMSGKGENRTAQTGYISRSLKALAKELDVPVVCVAQLNRGVDSRTDKRPTISDIRDSGEIEQDADVIMFTYLHEKYDEETPRKGIGELIVAKQRNGPTGSVFNEFQGQYQRFVPFTGVVPPMTAKEETENVPRMSSMYQSKGKTALDDKKGY